MQATQNTRREARTTRETRARGHEELPSRRGESNASIKIASGVDRSIPLLGRCAACAGDLELGAFRALASVPTCFETSPKMVSKCSPELPKSLQNRPPEGPKSTPGASRGPTSKEDAFVEPFFLPSGGSWGALGRPLARLGAVLAPLGSLLARLGAVLERSWSVLERSWSVLACKTLKS